MKSFGYGNRVVQASSIQEGLAIIAALYSREARKRLIAIKHGHDFGYDRVCCCGTREVDYIYLTRTYNEIEPCQAWFTENQPQQPPASS